MTTLTNEVAEPSSDSSLCNEEALCNEATLWTEATLLAEELVAALINSRIYAIDHPRLHGSIEQVRRRVATLCAMDGASSVRIGTYDGMLIYREKPLLGASLGVRRWNEKLAEFGAGGVEFDANCSDSDLTSFLTLLLERRDQPIDWSQCNARLTAVRNTTVRLLPPYTGVVAETIAEPVRLGLDFHQSVMDLLQTVTVQVCRGGRIDFTPVEAHAEMVLRRLERREGLDLGLARQDQYDAFTFGHSMRVALLSMNFAQQLTEDRELIVRIGTAALLHDVGKSLILFEILHSTRQLSDDERREMNRHAELGAQCLLDHDAADPLAVAAAFGHHLTKDGRGYPKTTHAHPVSFVTSIVKICDIFEALTAARPYKQPMSPIRAYRVMLAMGDQLDRTLLRRFIESNGVYPVGQIVELDDGSVAVVRRQSRDPLLPQVALFDGEHHSDLIERDETLIDLSEMPCDCVRRVLREMTPAEAEERFASQRA
jgi:putative nucleotidyltransferase with HDIG domain